MSSSGSCFCSKVKYSFTGQPAFQALCHCIECRKMSGSAFTTNLLVPNAAFEIVEGSGHIKNFGKTHESGMALSNYFCENCGTTLYKEADAPAFQGMKVVQAGTLDGQQMKLEDVGLGAELYVKYRAGWLGEMKGAAQCQEFV